MNTHYNVAKRLIAWVLGVSAIASWPALCNADAPPRLEKPKPKVVLEAGTQADADAAIAVMEKFLGLWDERKYEEASKLVAEPVRKLFVENMPKRHIEFRRVDDVRLFKRDEMLLAYLHASVAPSPERKDLKKQEIGMDMVFYDGMWWVTKR
jgi:hypothetical protein